MSAIRALKVSGEYILNKGVDAVILLAMFRLPSTGHRLERVVVWLKYVELFLVCLIEFLLFGRLVKTKC